MRYISAFYGQLTAVMVVRCESFLVIQTRYVRYKNSPSIAFCKELSVELDRRTKTSCEDNAHTGFQKDNLRWSGWYHLTMVRPRSWVPVASTNPLSSHYNFPRGIFQCAVVPAISYGQKVILHTMLPLWWVKQPQGKFSHSNHSKFMKALNMESD